MSSSEPLGPPAPGQTTVPPSTPPLAAQVAIQGARAPGAWQQLTHALGRDLQGGMHRAEQARRRIARLR